MANVTHSLALPPVSQSPPQLNAKTERAAKKAANFPQRRFAVKA